MSLTSTPTERRNGVGRRFIGAAKLAAVNCAIFSILLVIVELVFGNWVRPMRIDDLKRFSIPVGVKYQMDTSGLYAREHGPMITYTRDQWGLRGTHSQPGDVDVLTIGGSTTDQRYLDDSETWQAYAERWLRQHGLPLVFANAGVDGQSTTGHLFSVDNWLPLLPDLRPRIVLFYVGINDVMQPFDRESYDAKLDATSWRIKSVTWQILRTVRGNLRARDAQVMHGRMPPVTESDFTHIGTLTEERQLELAARLSERFIANVEGLRQRTHAMGATPIFVTQTAYAWDAGPSAPRGLNRPTMSMGLEMNFADVSALHRSLNQHLLDYCRAEDLLCLDLPADVALTSDDFYDFLHTTPHGAEKIGTYVAERLLANADRLAPERGAAR